MSAYRFGRLWLRLLAVTAVFFGWSVSISVSQPAACQAHPGTCPMPAAFGWSAAGLVVFALLTLAAAITRVVTR